LLEAYLELCISAFVNLKSFKFSKAGDRFASFTTASLTLVVIFLPPILTFVCIVNRLNMYMEDSFKERFGSFFEGLDCSRPISVMYYPAFTLRRLLFSWTAVFLTDKPLHQIQLFCICSTLYSIFLVSVKPFYSALINYIEIANEAAVFLFSVGLYLLTPLVTDSEARYQIGWGLIGLTTLVMVVNILVVVISTLAEVCQAIKGSKSRREKRVVRYSESEGLERSEVRNTSVTQMMQNSVEPPL